MSEQPWSVYESKSGRFVVRRWTTNAGLVACFISKEAARAFARGCDRDRKEEREVRRGGESGRAAAV